MMQNYIKKVIYTIKRIAFNIFGLKMEFKNINEIPPDVFVKSVFAATHKAYSSERKHIKHTKSVKLVLKVAEERGYTRLGHGFYKYGHFSFRVFDLMNTQFTYQSLFGLKRDQTLNYEFIDFVTPIVIQLNSKFLSQFNRFMKEAHTLDVPQEYVELYASGEKFERALNKLSKMRKDELVSSSKTIGEKISNLDNCLNFVQKEKIEYYFKFTELLENLLLAFKCHDFNATIGKNILGDLIDLYKRNISFLLYPYIETLSGGDIEYEKQSYNTTIENKINWSKMRLSEIEGMMTKYGLKPKIEDFDKEIELELNKMNQEKKLEIFNLLSLSE
ncbi:MAG: hypothetical protein A4E35_01536 [Methanoregula sp. PtaU1.Bin051]|nr:MAG: hypothetical protein A4E35_01536 [Methanoregula sp. PtaU1.Bin051]